MIGRIRGAIGAALLTGVLLGATAVALSGVLVLGAPPTALADGGRQQCQAQTDQNGDPAVCDKVDGQWVATYSDDGGFDTDPSEPGIPGWFGVIFVLVIVGGIGLTIWRVTTARSLARDSGMDPRLATQMTLLSDDGLDATYLAASLRQQHPRSSAPASTAEPAAPRSAAPRSAAERLAELKALQDQGLITQAEYDERRKAIIDGV